MLTLSDEDKKYILNGFLKNISHISDKEYQERIWIRGEGPEVNDFTEAVCQFFEIGESVLEEYQDFGISIQQYNLLVKFRDQFDKFVIDPRRSYLPQQFINSPEWDKITEMAKEVLKSFNYKKTPAKFSSSPTP